MIDAIANRELSPSQLSTFELCPRKWAWAKIEGIKGPSSPSAQFGTDVHEHLERYLRDGKPIDLSNGTGQLALAMLPYAPQPGTAAIEEWFYFDFWGHRLRGKKDAETSTTDAIVYDWKTTSDLMWAKSACPADAGSITFCPGEAPVCARCQGPVDRAGRCEKALVNDIAACVYATDAMLKSGLDFARLRWVYGVRKKPYRTVRPVEATLTREAVTPTLTRVKKLADEIASIPKGTRALDLPYDMNACSAFGGCPYVGLCNLSPEETMRSAMNQDLEAQKQAFYAHAEKLKQQQGGFGYAVNPPPQGQSMNQPPQGFQGPPQFTPPPNGQQFQGGPPQGAPPGQFSGPPQGGFAPPPGQGAPPSFQQPGGPPQGGFAPPPGQQFQGQPPNVNSMTGAQFPQTVNGTPAHPGWAPPQGAQGAPQFQGPPQGQGAPPSFQQPGQGVPQFQAPGAPQGAPPAEPAKAGRPKGSKNKNKASAMAGEPSYAMAYRLIAQGNEMLAQLSAEEESE